MKSFPRLYCHSWENYELLDAGFGKKLERFGNVITIRPEVNAYFKPELPFTEWKKQAHWEFIEAKGQKGKWRGIQKAPKNWSIGYSQLFFELDISSSKHVGLFPEQRINWDFIAKHLTPGHRFLNLFAYTGAASVVARQAGADVFHVDAVKHLLTKARMNMELNQLDGIHWVHEDALRFIQKEVRREKSYDFILMDPPAWGTGAKGERWKIEDQIDELLGAASNLLSSEGRLIINTYSPALPIHLLNELFDLYFPTDPFTVEELWMKSATGKELYFGNVGRVLKADQR
jgi:23S rRNA (cytosine1962-C5)-methyltransferase